MKNFILVNVILVLSAFGCSGPAQNTVTTTTPAKSDRIVANMDVKDPNARFLGQALAYINNLVSADEKMVMEFQSESRSTESIIAAIKTARDSEMKDFQSIEKAPKPYAPISQRLKKVHDDHTQAYAAYLQTFSMPNKKKMEESIDRGTNLIKNSMLKEMTEIKDMISVAMERDIAR